MLSHSQTPHNFHEKEFYKWLIVNRSVSEDRSRQVVIEIGWLELLAETLNLHSTKLFSRFDSEALETCTELISSGVLQKYMTCSLSHVVDPLDALKEYMTYITAKLTASIQSKQKKPLIWTRNSILYVHRGEISCQRNKHNIIRTTAVLLGLGKVVAELDVDYCLDCKRFFIGEQQYNIYRKQYGPLIGRIQFESSENHTYTGELLAEVSPLRLCGYTVNKADNLSDEARHDIIAKIIRLGIMTKSEVIGYLEYFIDHNGRQDRNQVAVEKWRRDLAFTMNFNSEEQDRYAIIDIQPYVNYGNNWSFVA